MPHGALLRGVLLFPVKDRGNWGTLHCGHLVAQSESEPGSGPDCHNCLQNKPRAPCEVRFCTTWLPITTRKIFLRILWALASMEKPQWCENSSEGHPIVNFLVLKGTQTVGLWEHSWLFKVEGRPWSLLLLSAASLVQSITTEYSGEGMKRVWSPMTHWSPCGSSQMPPWHCEMLRSWTLPHLQRAACSDTPRSPSKGGAGQDAGQRPRPGHTLLFVLQHLFSPSKYARST